MTGREATIRQCRAEEVDLIVEIEDLAGRRYADVGLPGDLPGLGLDVVDSARREGLLWVAELESRPVGFALCWERPGALHLRELDVLPGWMGQGLGRGLVEFVVAQAEKRGLTAVTLTTFRDVPWNGPLYRSWGFQEVPTEDRPEWLGEIRAEEEVRELSRWPRIAMRRDVVGAHLNPRDFVRDS